MGQLGSALLRATAIVLVGAAALTSGAVQAQTLQEALASAYSSNPTLQAARAKLRATDENVPRALAGWRPTVVLQGSAGYADGRSTLTDQHVSANMDRNTGSAAATLSQPIYSGGRTRAATAQAENQVYAERARLLASEQQVLLDTVTAYVNVIRDQQVVKLNESNVSVLRRQLQATNDRFRVGEITRTDVAQAEARLSGSQADLATAQGNLQTSGAIYARLVGRAPGQLTAPQPLAIPQINAHQVATASQNNPNVVAARFDEASARDSVDVQFSALMPQLSAQASSFRNDNPSSPDTRLTGSQATLNLSVPLYQGGAEHAAVRQARQQAQQARQIVDEVRRQALAQATGSWETYTAAKATVESTRAQIRAAEVALDGVQREALVGSRTTLDVLNQEQELLNARVALVRALANTITASYSLAASVGRLTARDLRLNVQLYDDRAYYNAVRNRWFGTGDHSDRN